MLAFVSAAHCCCGEESFAAFSGENPSAPLREIRFRPRAVRKPSFASWREINLGPGTGG